MTTRSSNNRSYRQESDYDKGGVVKAMDEIRGRFDRVGGKNGLSAEEEFAFVWTIFTSNLSLLGKACNAPEQLKRALMTGAGIGLTLDPARQYAYLVVRRGKLIYDVGYRGLVKLAVDEGLVRHVKPELVHGQDHFEYRGPHERPGHTSTNFFGDRGPIVGAYCEATLPDGSLVIETMREEEFVEIAQLNPDSDAWNKGFSAGEMRKKTIIKRASKWWYNAAVATGDAGERLQTAISYLNTEAGEGIPTERTDTASSGEDDHSAEPVYDPEEASAQAREHVAKLVERGMATGMWAACRQYAEERYQGADRAYALRELETAEKRAKDTGTSNSSGEAPEPS